MMQKLFGSKESRLLENLANELMKNGFGISQYIKTPQVIGRDYFKFSMEVLVILILDILSYAKIWVTLMQ